MQPALSVVTGCLQVLEILKNTGRGLDLGEHPQNFGNLLISATVESNDFKFGIQFGFGV